MKNKIRTCFRKHAHQQHAEKTSLFPPLIHVTHWKAGSQWVRNILESVMPRASVPPVSGVRHFLGKNIVPNKIYPTIYVTQEQFNTAMFSTEHSKFVVIRDMRDTMISAYFSILHSHEETTDIHSWRSMLREVDKETGLQWVLEDWLYPVARIQRSWWPAGEKMIRYEDLLINDVEIFQHLLIEQGNLPISREHVEQVVIANRFKNMTGRNRGNENIKSHQRKGVAGDWMSHFSPRLKEIFKAHYGGDTSGYRL